MFFFIFFFFLPFFLAADKVDAGLVILIYEGIIMVENGEFDGFENEGGGWLKKQVFDGGKGKKKKGSNKKNKVRSCCMVSDPCRQEWILYTKMYECTLEHA